MGMGYRDTAYSAYITMSLMSVFYWFFIKENFFLTKGIPYHHPAQGLLQEAGQTLLKSISVLQQEKQSDWPASNNDHIFCNRGHLLDSEVTHPAKSWLARKQARRTSAEMIPDRKGSQFSLLT